jgi:sugar lactone lactonase YvrE
VTIELKTGEVLLEGLAFPEAPRWHDGELWFSDFFTRRVMRVSPEGRASTVVEVPGQPSGLGWLPDGRLLVVSMTDRRLLRLDPNGLTTVADLRDIAPSHCNDMVVDRQGRAYIGNFGFDLAAKAAVSPTGLILVTPDGQARIVAEDLLFPNGSIITPDGDTLIVAETFGRRLTAFDIATDGSLSGRRIWAPLGDAMPDGICLDAEGATWVASPQTAEVLRVLEGGEITHRIPVNNQAIACMLGGPDRRTLFILTAKLLFNGDKSRTLKSGRIETLRVDVPGVGLP